LTVSVVPDATPPLFPIAKVYSIVPLVSAVDGPVFSNVKFAGALTVVAALLQLESAQEPLLGGSLGTPPVAPMVA
jgi:hypothetical protein